GQTLLTLTPGPAPRSVDLGTTGRYRVLATPTAEGVRVVGLSESRVQETVGRLVRFELTISAVVLVGAGALGLVLVRRELRPLQRMAATATTVSALPLDRG